MIAAYLEIRDGKIKKSSLEALSEAGRRAAELGLGTAAVLAGAAVSDLAPAAFAHGAAKVYVIENPSLADYSSQAYAVALAAFAGQMKPAALFFAATAMGKDLAPRVAARLGAALASDCTKIAVKDGALEFTRPIYAGKAFLSLRLKSTPQLATLRPNVFPLAPAGAGAGSARRSGSRPPSRRGRSKAASPSSSRKRAPSSMSPKPTSSFRAAAGSRAPRPSASSGTWPRSFPGPPSARRARPSIRAGSATSIRSGRRARPCRRGSTWPSASPARSSTWPGCRPRRSSSPSTRTRKRRSSRSRITALSAISSRSCRSSRKRSRRPS